MPAPFGRVVSIAPASLAPARVACNNSQSHGDRPSASAVVPPSNAPEGANFSAAVVCVAAAAAFSADPRCYRTLSVIRHRRAANAALPPSASSAVFSSADHCRHSMRDVALTSAHQLSFLSSRRRIQRDRLAAPVAAKSARGRLGPYKQDRYGRISSLYKLNAFITGASLKLNRKAGLSFVLTCSQKVQAGTVNTSLSSQSSRFPPTSE